MRADIPPLESDFTAKAEGAAPFACEYVTLTKQEHFALKSQAQQWKTLHAKAVIRHQWREQRYARILREFKAQARLDRAKFALALDEQKAKVRDLNKRVFGSKCEHKKRNEQNACTEGGSGAARGQRRGARGHGRTLLKGLPVRHEDVSLSQAHCKHCGLEFYLLGTTEDSEIVEIEVKAYRRCVHRQRYRPGCQCNSQTTIIVAPPPPRLIGRGKFGVSVWTSVLLDKFLYGRPSHRLLQDFADHGLHMAAGTLAGGLQSIAPLFAPIDTALQTQLRSEPHWHCDETRWAVLTEVEGKVGHRWYLWVFHSQSVVHYVLDPTRACTVIEDELAGVTQGIISCDRYSAYKKFARLNPGVSLSYCWAHQRRDFLELANSYPDVAPWAMCWVDSIGELYRLNAVRQQTLQASSERAAAQAALETAVQEMAAQRDLQLVQCLPSVVICSVLQSMTVHWVGLTLFVQHPELAMDNNTAERDMRSPVVGRKNFYGSGSEWSGELAATLYGVLQTLKLHGINARTWLQSYLQACAQNGGAAPFDITAFLPWQMNPSQLEYMRRPNFSKGIDSS